MGSLAAGSCWSRRCVTLPGAGQVCQSVKPEGCSCNGQAGAALCRSRESAQPWLRRRPCNRARCGAFVDENLVKQENGKLNDRSRSRARYAKAIGDLAPNEKNIRSCPAALRAQEEQMMVAANVEPVRMVSCSRSAYCYGAGMRSRRTRRLAPIRAATSASPRLNQAAYRREPRCLPTRWSRLRHLRL